MDDVIEWTGESGEWIVVPVVAGPVLDVVPQLLDEDGGA